MGIFTTVNRLYFGDNLGWLRNRDELLGSAFAFPFPIDWPEPFGLVMIEALACGTPVIGFHCGSVPEIIVEGEVGFIVEDIDRAVEAVGKIDQISRARCRREFEQGFTDRHMAHDYVRIYQQLLSRSSTQAAA